jgi:hypothetical protein
MKVFIIISAFLLVQVYGNVINAKCDSQLFGTCIDTFAKALGLPYMPTDASVLDNQIKQLENKGKQGQQQVCRAAADLKACLGAEYSDCISVAFLKSIGESDADAKKFVDISKQLQKLCVQVNLAVDAKCESQLFTTCTDTFAKALGLPSMPSDANVLDKQIKQIEAKGRQGKQQVCQAAGKLQSCLGQEYNDCISVAYLKSIGESEKDAKEFVEISHKLEKQCVQVNMATNANKCDQVVFGLCTGMFANALGLPLFPTDPSILDKQIKQDQAKGKQGQTQVCNAASNLVACLEPTYTDCISVAYFKSIGESDADAQKFVTIIQQQVTQCAQINLAVNAKCESQLFTTCTDTFAKALGLPSMPSDASVLNKQIKQLEEKGRQGQQQVCQAAGKLQSCLGQEYNDCISVAYLKSIGESDKDAKEFVEISKKLEKHCAQVSLATNAKCNALVFTTCTDTFATALSLPVMPSDSSVLDNQIKQLESQGKQQQVCQAAGNLQTCLGNEYDDCMSVAYLKQIGESEKDAKEFLAISQQLQKQCVKINMATNDNKCDSVVFGLCTGMFANALGLPQFPTDPSILDKQIKQDQAKGKQGQTQVCNAASNLVACMEPAYSDCISVAYFKSIGESDADAQKFVKIIQQQVTQCAQLSLAVNDKCESQLFTACTDTFAKALGLSAMPSDARVLLLQIMTVEAKGQQGAMQVCQAESNLQSCLGVEYDDCLSVAFLKSIGESDADAQAFVKLSDLLKKTCVH